MLIRSARSVRVSEDTELSTPTSASSYRHANIENGNNTELLSMLNVHYIHNYNWISLRMNNECISSA